MSISIEPIGVKVSGSILSIPYEALSRPVDKNLTLLIEFMCSGFLITSSIKASK